MAGVAAKSEAAAFKKLVFIRVHLSRRSCLPASPWLSLARIRNLLQLVVGAKADSWLVEAR